MKIDYDKANLVQEKVAEKLGVDPNERKIDEFDVMDFMARIESVVKELEDRANHYKKRYRATRDLAYRGAHIGFMESICLLRQVINGEDNNTRHTAGNE